MREYKYLGNFSAVEPVYSRYMYCDDCMVCWIGCWDNFMCPTCQKGYLPSPNIDFMGFDFSKFTLK